MGAEAVALAGLRTLVLLVALAVIGLGAWGMDLQPQPSSRASLTE
jgi:hypothetical protein